MSQTTIRNMLPHEFVSNIINVFGKEGRISLDELDDRVETCRQRWNLSDIQPVDTLSFNLACFARSQSYGDVVLKIGVPHPELFTEMKSINLYGSHVMCACCESDERLGAMLLERISPGGDLRSVEDLKLRTQIAGRLMHQMHQSVTAELSKRSKSFAMAFPPISKWLDDAFIRARKESKVGEKMLFFIDQAEKCFSQLIEDHSIRSKSSVLLHGDLHHYNILQDKDSWRAIDPKGVFGPKSMEPAAFILNQFEFNQEGNMISLEEMIRIFHEETGESVRDLAIAVFVFSVLSVTWTYEQEVLPSENELNKLHRQIQTCFEYAASM